MQADSSTIPCRVLTGGVISRLALTNQATRSLRALGYRVIRQELFPGGRARPCLLIARSLTQSMNPLLDRAQTPYWRTENGRRRGYAEFCGVTVSWEEC